MTGKALATHRESAIECASEEARLLAESGLHRIEFEATTAKADDDVRINGIGAVVDSGTELLRKISYAQLSH